MKTSGYLVSKYSNQNELLALHLLHARSIELLQIDFDTFLKKIESKHNSQKLLVLYDWLRNDNNKFWEFEKTIQLMISKKIYFVIYNFEHNNDLIKEVLFYGVRGVFFENDTISLIDKGVIEILKGELWYSRKILAECLQENNSFILKTIKFNDQCLTDREKEILSHIVAGQKNHEIAENLGVSIHTVKTHVYKIFQKLQVTSRLKASLWALKNASFETKITDSSESGS